MANEVRTNKIKSKMSFNFISILFSAILFVFPILKINNIYKKH